MGCAPLRLARPLGGGSASLGAGEVPPAVQCWSPGIGDRAQASGTEPRRGQSPSIGDRALAGTEFRQGQSPGIGDRAQVGTEPRRDRAQASGTKPRRGQSPGIGDRAQALGLNPRLGPHLSAAMDLQPLALSDLAQGPGSPPCPLPEAPEQVLGDSSGQLPARG